MVFDFNCGCRHILFFLEEDFGNVKTIVALPIYLLLILGFPGSFAQAPQAQTTNVQPQQQAKPAAAPTQPVQAPAVQQSPAVQQQAPMPQQPVQMVMPSSAPPSTPKKADQEDYLPTPYTEFGDFSDPEEERSQAQFYQSGRFFGLGVYTGFHGVEGNRGALWRGGFPMMAFKLHYWFDFQFGFQLEYDSASHFYEPTAGTRIDIGMTQIGLILKFYFDTRKAAAAVAFSNPYLMIGAGSYKKVEKNLSTDLTSTLSTVGVSFGAGLEFPIVYRKTYFNVEGRAFFVPFADRLDQPTGTTLTDLQGLFYQATVGVMFVW